MTFNRHLKSTNSKNSYGIINATMNSRAVKIERTRSLHFVAIERDVPVRRQEHFYDGKRAQRLPKRDRDVRPYLTAARPILDKRHF